MTQFSPDEQPFHYTAIDRTGKQVRDVIRARDSRAAAHALRADGLTPIQVSEAPPAAAGGKGANRGLTFAERVSVLRQLGLMVEAGVGLLEAFQTIALGMVAMKARAQMEAAIAALKRGERLATALEANLPGYPFYVYAMCRVGEATGKIAEVLMEASQQMAFEAKLRKEVTGSLVYPAILLTVGIAVVTFLLTFVLPSFRGMIDPSVPLPFPSNMMFALSDSVTHNPIVPLSVLGAIIFIVVATVANKTVRGQMQIAARKMPLIGPILRAYELTAWSRLLGFALSSGVNLLEAAALARAGASAGPFRDGLEHIERDLKAGVDVAETVSRHTTLKAMDISLLRAGQKSGTLPRMLLYIADEYDDTLRTRLKALAAMIEPLTIGFIAVLVALIALSIALAMITTYQNIGT